MSVRVLWVVRSGIYLFVSLSLSRQVIDKVHEFGSGLVHAGNDPGKNKFVAIFSQNRPEVRDCFFYY